MPDHMQRQTTTTRRGANHGLHIILSIFTCGLWAVTGWPIAAAMGRKTKTTTYVPQQLPPAGPPQQYGPPPAAYGQQQAYGQPYGNQSYAPQQPQLPPAPYGQQPQQRTTWGQQ